MKDPKMQAARVAFANWFQERIGSRQWGEVAATYHYAVGSFHDFMRGKRALPESVWRRMVEPNGYFARRWSEAQMAEGLTLWEATKSRRDSGAEVLQRIKTVRGHVVEMRRVFNWLKSAGDDYGTNPIIALDEIEEELKGLEKLV